MDPHLEDAISDACGIAAVAVPQAIEPNGDLGFGAIVPKRAEPLCEGPRAAYREHVAVQTWVR
jgi:hypothetical protein